MILEVAVAVEGNRNVTHSFGFQHFCARNNTGDVIEENDLHFEFFVGKAAGTPVGRGHVVFSTYMVLALAFSSLRLPTRSSDAWEVFNEA